MHHRCAKCRGEIVTGDIGFAALPTALLVSFLISVPSLAVAGDTGSAASDFLATT
jgi:hypothetical protein